MKSKGIGVVVLSNSAPSIDDIGLHLLESRFPLALGPKQHREVPLDAKLLEAYVGEYQLAPTFSITVTREGNTLFIQATGQSKLPVYAESETEFFLKAVDAQITFVKGDRGVSGLILHQNGRNTPCRKVK